jgi:hypothetical protein
MKTFILLIVFLLLTSFMQVDPEPIKFTWHTIVAILVGLYEVIIRIIPTIGNYSLLGKIVDIIKWVSDFLNRKKKK